MRQVAKERALRPLPIAAGLAIITLGIWAFAQTAAEGRRDLAALMPSGPLLYLEARDFSSTLKDWNGSPEKKAWLEGENFQAFSRSRLYLKLQSAQAEFAAAAGVPANMTLVEAAAGGQSALALYDIGDLRFLYITRMPAERFAATALWKMRGSYQPRQAAGFVYFVKTDAATRRVAAFAVVKDYALLATDEDVLARALALAAGQPGAALKQEAWFAQTTQAAQSLGEVRMAANFERVVRSPHFRSYWVQRNAPELNQYGAFISDAERAAGEIVERRILLRKADVAPAWKEAAVAEILRLAPADAGLVRAWAAPPPDDVAALLSQMLEPKPGGQPPSRIAPGVTLGDGVVGAETDLETAIDEPSADADAQPASGELRRMLGNKSVDAMLAVESTRVQPGAVFTGMEAGAALLSDADWDGGAVREALSAALARLHTTDRLGVGWVRGQAGARGYFVVDGLAQVALAVNGRLLLVATGTRLMEEMLARMPDQPAPEGARYAAVYRHAKELPAFLKIVGAIDNAAGAARPPNEPAFFSGNLASLARALGRVESESILVHDTGAVVSQTLHYRFVK